MKLKKLLSAFILLWLAVLQFSFAQEVKSQDVKPPFPKLEFRKWSGEINVPDPVAISVDEQGQVYVTQTQRRKVQDLDIREHRAWVQDDLGLQTVEDKREFFKAALAIGGDEASQSQEVQDWNGDGVHDWRDLTVISEVIYRLTDRDQDGTADEIVTFADNFKTEVTGIAAGVMAYHGDVYATVAPDLWKLSDNDGDGKADSQISIAHGFGLHIAYGGHDMHGLTMGPDGKVYWSIGDKGINVTTADGENFAYPHEGGVMRCNPDGSDFEVFAHGLRNVQELAFDQYGNLFGVDNDADQPAEKERFVYIVNEMDAGWRNYYQHRGDDYNPWVHERLWELAGEHHPAYIVPPLSHYIDGPAGFKFNPGTALGPQYKDFFFLTGAPNGNQYAFRVEPNADAYRMVDEHEIGSGYAIVGLAFGPDGALYGADWDGGYPLDQKGSIIRIDLPSESNSELRQEVRRLLANGFKEKPLDELVQLLAHADQRVRLESQFELVRRQASDMLAATATNEGVDLLARLHGLWGLAQLARQGDILGRDTLGILMRDSNAYIKGQAAKMYGELRSVNAAPLIKLLADQDAHVRTLAALALGRQPSEKAVAPLLEQAEKLVEDLHYLRHGIVVALSQCASVEQLVGEAQHASELRRMCCALALRRKGSEQIAVYLKDRSDWVATEAARAIHDDESIPGALTALSLALLERDSQSEAFTRRALNANFRLGDPAAAKRLIAFAKSEGNSPSLRALALNCLSVWMAPSRLDLVEGIYRELPTDHRNLEGDSIAQDVLEILSSQKGIIRSSAIRLAEELELELPLDVLRKLAVDETVDDGTRVLALESLSRVLDEVLAAAEGSSSESVRSRAMELRAAKSGVDGLKRLQQAIAEDPSTAVRQAAVAMLADSRQAEMQDYVLELGKQLARGEVDSALGLDVWEALVSLAEEVPQASAVMEEIRKSQIAVMGEAAAKYAFSRDGGDEQNGGKIFRTHIQAQCARCHRIGRVGSEIGPELTTIAKTRDADYLLRSITQPSADIDARYRTQMLLLESGQVIKGVIQKEDEKEVLIADATGEVQAIATNSIEQRSEQTVSLMPEMSEILTPREVRDLTAYLRTLK